MFDIRPESYRLSYQICDGTTVTVITPELFPRNELEHVLFMMDVKQEFE